jgi:thiol-disulfide isomerase/thioredoxin
MILPKGLKMQFKKMSFLTFFFILLFTGCDFKSENDKKEAIKNAIAQENANFFVDLHTINNEILKAKISKNKIEFEDLKDKVILVTFFATWCPPCKAEIPYLIELKEKYPNDVEIIGVLLEKDKNNDDMAFFVNEFGINYKITNSSNNYLLEQAVGGIKTIPTMYLLNKKGEIQQRYVGMILEEMLDIDVKKALEK